MILQLHDCILNLCLLYAHIHAQTDTHHVHVHFCTELSNTV